MKQLDRFTDIIGNAEYLFSMHPAPWGFYEKGIDGYVVDANGSWIFGGEKCEGYVGKDDKEIQALVDVVNSIWVFLSHEEKTCECFHKEERIKGWINSNTPILEKRTVCWGTREKDECSCGGDKSKCNFYKR